MFEYPVISIHLIHCKYSNQNHEPRNGTAQSEPPSPTSFFKQTLNSNYRCYTTSIIAELLFSCNYVDKNPFQDAFAIKSLLCSTER